MINALTHPGYLKEKNSKLLLNNDFERFEFLGDRVLGLSISSILFKKFKNSNEGDLSKKYSYFVQKKFLYIIAKDLSIKRILLYNNKKNNKRMESSIISDSVESLIGAIFLDRGFEDAFKFIKFFWSPYLDTEITNISDPKTNLQEISQRIIKKLPEYKLISKEGPPHSPIFTISLKVLSLKKIITRGESIRDAEKEAAKIALEKINENKNIKN